MELIKKHIILKKRLKSLNFFRMNIKTYYMFSGCTVLPTLDISGFKMSNVTAASSMFLSCKEVEVLDVSLWDTSKVTNMNSTFLYCGACE